MKKLTHSERRKARKLHRRNRLMAEKFMKHGYPVHQRQYERDVLSGIHPDWF